MSTCCRWGCFPDQEKILIILFHPVFFPGILFQKGGVGSQLFQFLTGGSDLLFVVLLAGFQLSQFLFFPEMAGDKVPGVEKQDPDRESQRCQHIFVLQPGRNDTHK